MLYAPRDYSVESYVGALNSNRRRQSARVDAAIKTTLDGVFEALLTSAVDEVDRDAVERDLTEAVRGEVADSIISIRLDRFDPTLSSEPLEFVADPDMPVSNPLDFTYYALSDHVRPFSYGKEWLFGDEASVARYPEMGSLWAKAHLKRTTDDRPLREVGLRPRTASGGHPPVSSKTDGHEGKGAAVRA